MSLVKYGGKTKQEQIQYTPSNFGRQPLNSFKISNNSPYIDPSKEYERTQERIRQTEQEKKQALINAVAEAQSQNEDDIFTVNDLYEAAVDKRNEGDGLTAAQYFWTSLICGEVRSAYPLFEMLRDGEAGVGRNMEMAGLILYTGKVFKSPECRAIKGFPGPSLDITGKVADVCFESQENIGSQNITNDIADLRVAKAEEALDQFSSQLKTRAHEEPMVLVFAHPDFEEANEVELSGNDSSHDHGSKCVIM